MHIKLFNRNILMTYNHLIMKRDIDSVNSKIDQREFELVPITLDNIGALEGGYFSVFSMRQLLENDKPYVDGYMITDIKSGKCLSYAWIGHQGYNQRHYKLRNTDAFLFKVATMPEYKGKGYCGKLIDAIADIVSNSGTKEILLAVMNDNASAIRAYEKNGFEVIGKRKFIRLLRYNIPYYEL